METMIIKRREFTIIKKYNDKEFKAQYKNKLYFVRKYEPKSEEFNLAVYHHNLIVSYGFPLPKIKYLDKKNGYIVNAFVEGPTILDLIADHDLPEEIYKKIFTIAWLGKTAKMVVNFKPDYWIYKDGELFFLDNHLENYEEKKDFANNGIRYWFFTNELIKYAEEKGYTVDKTRLKESYALNKEIVLIACKYYR